MSILGEKDAVMVKKVDAAIKCCWNWSWLKKEGKILIKGQELAFHLSDVFQKINKQGFARCTLCQKEINYANKGSHALLTHCQTEVHKKKVEMIASTHSVASILRNREVASASQGPEAIRQQCQEKIPVPVAHRIANAEAMVLGAMAEHSVPFAMAPVIVELAQTLAMDKVALQGMKLSLTAASYKMVHGLGLTFSERTFSNMRRYPFSLNLDESTSKNNKKVLSMLVSYYHPEFGKVMVEHLASLEVIKVNAASLEKVLSEFLEKNNLPWKNLVSILMDSCAVMRGSKTGFETRMRQYCPTLLDIDGDSCHHIHNAAKKFSEPFDGYLEKLFGDLQLDHLWSSDQVMYHKEIAHILNLPTSSPLRGFVPHRWLSAYDASLATHAMMPAYKVLYFGYLSTADKELYREPLELMYKKYNVNLAARSRINVIQKELNSKGMTPQGRERKKRICQKLWHEETTTALHLSLYMGVLAILKEYVMVFQGSQTLVHKLHDRQLELFLAFMACFVKAEYITQLSPKALGEIVLKDAMLLPSREVYVGQEADKFKTQYPSHALLVPFLANVRKAYSTTAVYLQKKLPLASPTLTALSALDPLLRGHSQATTQLKRLSGMLGHLLPSVMDIQRELINYSVDMALPSFKEGDDMVEWWGHVFAKQDKYPSLSALAKSCLSIFHGPQVESSFSIMNDIIDERSGNMNVMTFNAIQTVKYTLQSKEKTAIDLFRREDVRFDEVDRTLCKNVNSAAATYKRQLKKQQLEKQQQRGLYGSEVTGSSSLMKSQKVDQEKRARLKHLSKNRKQALQTLAKKMK